MQAQTTSGADRDEIRDFMQERGLSSADTDGDIAALRALAARLIPAEIASVPVLAQVQRRTGHSLFLKRVEGSATAFLACFALTQAGERAIRSGCFDALRIAPQWISPYCASTRAGYIWGLGGVSGADAFAVMRALRIMRARFFAHIDLYARATTSQGRKLMEGFGYLPFGGSDPNVLLAPALGALPMARAS